MDGDVVTGATVEVMIETAMDPEQVWSLVTAVERIGEWSPECTGGRWLSDRSAPHVGARFEGDNRFPGGFGASTLCEVVTADAPRCFEWAVLDDRHDADRPGSVWRYDVSPATAAGGTFVRHRFVHGPGMTGVRDLVERQPDRAAEIVTARLQQLGQNIECTLVAMLGATILTTASHVGTNVPLEVTR